MAAILGLQAWPWLRLNCGTHSIYTLSSSLVPMKTLEFCTKKYFPALVAVLPSFGVIPEAVPPEQCGATQPALLWQTFRVSGRHAKNWMKTSEWKWRDPLPARPETFKSGLESVGENKKIWTKMDPLAAFAGSLSLTLPVDDLHTTKREHKGAGPAFCRDSPVFGTRPVGNSGSYDRLRAVPSVAVLSETYGGHPKCKDGASLLSPSH
ncbi:hypothetical protein GGX14DRAFT_386550 [Mycena pura]|uniref:Uncharacterized protein n=1 Tax=Mycena pura TaxID=153505 RepID=A0AAD7E3S3_9AGAR|nr:hypothetical protein GGX14DRAFT_386550 [Mycena pura]